MGVLVVFPEGTWSSAGELLPGRPGVGKVIHDARPQKIIPVALKGTEEILPQKSWIPRIGRRTKIRYGKPMDLSRFYESPGGLETSQQIMDSVMAEIKHLQSSFPSFP